MEHEVFVPVEAERLRQALAEPTRVARAVPGLQQDAGAEPVAGRLKVRLGSHSITYRGSLRVSARDDGSYAMAVEAVEARGGGTVELALTLRLRDADEGTAVTVEGTATATGRVTELPADTVSSAAIRLLNRWVAALATEADGTAATGDAAATGDVVDTAATVAGTPSPENSVGPANGTRTGTEGGSDDVAEAEDEGGTRSQEEARASVFETEVPPPSPAPDADDDRGSAETPSADAPPAEAAHARRTMIGRSAEEVDHAPPRGRYAPVPAPQTVAASSVLRWAAPAAALALASAIVVGRALRRRR
jgi:carbon monoxide dehydrogenase subunit G